jgi:tetratricopeptide (TPR) repeat protein
MQAPTGEGLKLLHRPDKEKGSRPAGTLRAIGFCVCLAVIGVSSAAKAAGFEDCFSQDDLDRIVKGCTQVIKDKSSSPDDRAQAYVNRGGVYGRRDECDKAIADYTKAIEIKPNLASAYNNRAYCYSTQDKRDLALADYNKAIELDPNDPFYYRNRASFYMEEKKYDLAIADYSKSIDIDPKVAATYAGRAEAHKADTNLAIADYTKAIELDPKNPDYYSSRGILYHVEDNPEAAIADFTKAIGMQEEDESGSDYWFRGQAYMDVGQYDAAIADLTKSLDGLGEDMADFAPLVLYDRAVAKGLKGDLDGEIADWDELLKQDPDTSSAYYLRGAARYFQGDASSAEKDMLRSMELKPSAYAAALLFLVQTANGANAKSALEANAQKIEEKDWPLPVVDYFLGKQSEAELLKATTIRWQICETNVLIGWLKAARGDRSGASEMLKQAVATCPKGGPALTWAKSELKLIGSPDEDGTADQGAVAAPATGGISQEVELAFWNSVKDSDDPDMLQAYLDKFPNGTFAALAKIKIDKLKEAR